MKRSIRQMGFHLAVVVLCLCLSIVAYSASSVSRAIHLSAGKASTVDLAGPVADVLIANPAVADVGTLRANRLYVVGRAIGDTNVLAFDQEGNQLADISVHVRLDNSSLNESLKMFFPNEDIHVKTMNANIVLTGTVSTPAVANQVRDLASRFVAAQGQTVVDLMSVEGEQQVMLQVKIIEANRTALREYGVETDYKPANIGSTTNAALNSAARIGLASTTAFAAGQIFFDDNGDFGPIKFGLQGLEENGLLNTLAEPNLTAISGETAGFLAGGEFPVPTGVDQDGNVTIEFKQFGVALNFTPTVLSGELISLHLATEVSTLTDTGDVVLQGLEIPGLSVRRAETTVEMSSGGTIMIAGLIKSDTVNALTGLPGAMDVPILGELFRSKSFERDETELIILVTPYLVKPYGRKNAQVLAQAEPVLSADPEHAPTGGHKFAGSGMPPLSRKLLDNIHKVYGSRMPRKISAGESFGYIVD